MFAQLFVHGLPIRAGTSQRHQHPFSGGEGCILLQVVLNGWPVEEHPVDQTGGGGQQFVSTPGRLPAAGYGDWPESSRVRSSNECAALCQAVVGHASQQARQRVDLLSLNGVAFEGHGRRANLLAAKRL